MAIVLYMAISADGFIASPNDDTPWSDDEWGAFRAFVKTCDAVLLGRRTYEIMCSRDEFVDGPEHIVVTNNTELDTGGLRKLSISEKADVPRVKKLGVIGGGELNGSLARLDVFDELMLDVEPVTLGAGVRLFGSRDIKLNLELVTSERLGSGTLHNRYLVIDESS